MNQELTDRCTSWILKRQRTRDQIANMCWITEKARQFQKNIYFCFIDYAKAFDCTDHINKLRKFFKIWEYHLTCLLRNLYVGHKATVRIRHETTDAFKIGKGEQQGCILLSCLFNFYAKYIMCNTRLG